jgi:hypothetical protein
MRDALITVALWLVSVSFFAASLRDFWQLYPKPENGWRFFAYSSAVIGFTAMPLMLIYLSESPWFRAIPFGIGIAGLTLLMFANGWMRYSEHQGRMWALFVFWRVDEDEDKDR